MTMFTVDEVEERRRLFGEWIDQHQNALYPRPSDREMAKRIGITATHLGYLKNGKTGTRRDTALKIAKAFGRPGNEVLDLAGLALNKTSEPEVRFARRLYAILGDMTEPDREKAESTLESVALSLRAWKTPSTS